MTAPDSTPAASAYPAIRPATRADLPALGALVEASIAELQRGFLDAVQIAASRAIMGVDARLVDDGTYLLVEGPPGERPVDAPVLAAAGGWSYRATPYGGDHSAGRDDRVLDPAHEAARIRAMYTHPAHARRGLGRLVLAACEAAARAAGFRRAELTATLAGEPLYHACGYTEVARFAAESVADGAVVRVPLVRMAKML
jgi:GNAT superfamily N-acetyltransferase